MFCQVIEINEKTKGKNEQLPGGIFHAIYIIDRELMTEFLQNIEILSSVVLFNLRKSWSKLKMWTFWRPLLPRVNSNTYGVCTSFQFICCYLSEHHHV